MQRRYRDVLRQFLSNSSESIKRRQRVPVYSSVTVHGPEEQEMKSKTVPTDLTRRLALQRLGLAAGAAYVAPVIMSLSDARASSGGGSGGGGGGGGGSGGSGGGGGMGGAGGGSSSMPSEPSAPSVSGPSSDDSADASGTGDGTGGATIRETASAVAKVPGKVFNGVKGLFSR
jgi:hypothetical protein